ncbi:cell division protein ZapA [Aquisalimonas asiatica]|uniref:Cell division protein ZapA n=1 Tax=Aquisalimonas asiatica TaxID=406100 RepID=A0A1H8VKI2_9GAMM|nr:cell division protein ZapA [Aquisalimonas asiatica]SEP15843.1 cell division protein ZapA [Aquisalimonas asiatica]
MRDDIEPVRVTILDKEYMVACPPDEKEGLLSSAHMLDRRMREVRDAGRIQGADRIAVMAALNLTHELLQAQNDQRETASLVEERVRAMEKRINQVLPES